MSKVLLIGVGPLPSPTQERVHATGLRLRAFVDALTIHGHQTLLAEMLFSGVHTGHQPIHGWNIFAHRRLDSDGIKGGAQIAQWLKEFDPDAIIALTDVGALAAVKSGFPGPLLVDFFGDPMAERQQLCATHGNNETLAEQWLTILPALLNADHFSVCSASQRLALIGQLGAAGRLNAETCATQMVTIVPPMIPFAEPLVPKRRAYLEDRGVPADAKVIFSSGGYNTWVDEETLFRGIEGALQRDPNLHFVSTGGAVPGHVTVIYDRFKERIGMSPVRERCHLLGWLPHDDMLDAMLGADVGVNCDVPSLEGELGCRNRLLGWLWGGLRVVTTVSSDPTRDLVEQGHVRAVPFGDAKALADALVDEAALGRRKDLTNLHATLRERWNGAKELAAICKWADAPTTAPDRKATIVKNPLAQMQQRFLDSADRNRGDQMVRRQARATAQTLLGSRIIRLYGKWRPESMKLLRDLKDV
ncbi:hypothetical protein BH09SUM1_BH09SUM1_24500 [soil metagenome]